VSSAPNKCCNKKILHKDGAMEILTPYPKINDMIAKHNRLEHRLSRHKHIMELLRTVIATLVLILQVVILWMLF